MLYVVVFAVSVFVAGLVMVFLLGRRTYRQLRVMTSTAAETSQRIADAAAELETIAPRDRHPGVDSV